MKFNCDVIRDWRQRQRVAALALRRASMEWHTIFALLPHRVAANDCRWLEPVERRYVYKNYNLHSLDSRVKPEHTDRVILEAVRYHNISVEYRAKE